MKRRLGKPLYGWQIDPTAYIGTSVITVRNLTMGPRTFIGRRNVITSLEELRMEAGASIGARNRITGWWQSPDNDQNLPKRRAELILGEDSYITADHYIDCVDRVELGAHSAIAGFRTTVLTHSVDLMRDRYTTGSVILADYCAVMAGCMLLPGARVPRRSIISAGSVVTTKLTKEQTLYRGNPAEPVRSLPDSLAYFRRGPRHLVGTESTEGDPAG
jgi:acetyltransferase-like isoleucine patch superfamily enzyme